MIIARIEGALPESVDLLVRTERNLNVDALALLEPEQLQKLGVRTIKGVDIPFVKIGDNDTEALAKFVIAAAQSRQGEDDPAKVKKGKAKAKVAA